MGETSKKHSGGTRAAVNRRKLLRLGLAERAAITAELAELQDGAAEMALGRRVVSPRRVGGGLSHDLDDMLGCSGWGTRAGGW